MEKYLGIFLIAASIVMLAILLGGTPGEDLLLYWSAMEKL